MRLSEAEKSIGKTVYYSFGGKIYECIFSASILRADKKCGHSVMIANLKDVFLRADLKQN